MQSKRWDQLISPVESAGVGEAVVRRLGELLGSGVLSPGEQLPSELELAGYFGVAPMTVRTALSALREYGFVETRRGRGAGTFVRKDVAVALSQHASDRMTIAEFADFTVWREAISGEACARAARNITPEQTVRLRQLADESHPSLPVPADYGFSDFRLADARLHLYIAEIAASPRLIEAEQQIQSFITRTLRHVPAPPDTRRFAAQGHRSLVDAIAVGDADRARECLIEHVRATLDMAAGVAYLEPEAAELARSR